MDQSDGLSEPALGEATLAVKNGHETKNEADCSFFKKKLNRRRGLLFIIIVNLSKKDWEAKKYVRRR